MKFWSPSVKVGAMLVIAAILLVLLLTNAENWPWATAGDEMRFEFSTVSGLYIGAGVYLSGVSIGKVTSINLQPETNNVEIRAKVKNGFQWLREGCGARISMNGFVGEVYIALDNGPIGNRTLTPDDLPIIGTDPVNALELLEQTSAGMTQAIELTKAANELLQSNQESIELGIKEIRELVALSARTIEKLTVDSEETVNALMQLAFDNDKRLQQTFLKANRLLSQLEGDSLMVSSQISDISRELLRLMNQNSPKLEGILTDIATSSSEFRQLTREFRNDFDTLSNDISALVTKGSTALDTGEANIAPILENLQATTAAFTALEENINRLLTTVQEGEGTVAQLLNTPEPLADARRTLNNVNETMTAVRALSQQTGKQLKSFELPKLGWDYELRYLGQSLQADIAPGLQRHLHNELAFSLSPQPNSHYRIGLGVRNEKIAYEFQYAYDVTDSLRARVGFMRSKVGAGLEFWLLSRRLGINIEGVGLTGDAPQLNTELAIRLFRHGELLLGVENLIDERRWTTGFRFINSEW